MPESILVTGNSSGLGRGLTQIYLDTGARVYGLSRRGCQGLGGDLHDIRCDLSDRNAIPLSLSQLLKEVKHLDLIVLNAGILGPIEDLSQTRMDTIDQVMEINVWSNKLILDWLLNSGMGIGQILLISSGAAVNGSRGWGAYSLSKATLNMLTMLYAHEFKDTHLSALAPGLVDTQMQDYLCDPGSVDESLFPSVKKLRTARHTDAMPTPRQAARKIVDLLPRLRALPSGSFADLRTLAN